MKYFSSWSIHTEGLSNLLQDALTNNQISSEDIVWRGPSGDAVVAASPYEIEEEYADYTDGGFVSDYID